MNNIVLQGLAADQRVFDVIDRQPEVTDRPGACTLEAVERAIEFEDVSFRYDEKPVLRGINLRINKNETIAVVGESGAGKTTLANLKRFYDVTDGR